MSKERSCDYKLFVVAAIAAFVTFAIYLPALGNGFVTWDDNSYVYDNLNITRLDTRFIEWAFTTPQVGVYAPLTMLSFGVDYFLWNLRPWGYHLTNLVLHAINTFLVVMCIARILQSAAGSGYLYSFSRRRILITSGITGLLFGVHPVHVESVAWVSERKDVLYAFFFLVSVLAYLTYATAAKRRGAYYILALITFVFALLSKAMAVTLPVVLVILDVYPLNRLSAEKGLASVRRALLEKLPFFSLSVVFSIVAVFAQRTADAMAPADFSLFDRVLTSGRAVFFYLQKLIVPADLSPLYPLFLPVSLTAKDIMIFSALIGITFLCFRSWQRKRVWAIVWLYYLVSVLPVSGLLQVGGQAAADRYTYMSLIGPMALIGGGIAEAEERIRSLSVRRILPGLFVAGLLVLFTITAMATVRQIDVWKDGMTLWNRVFALYPDNVPVAYRGRAEAYLRAGDFNRAITDYSSAIRLDSLDYRSYSTRGIVYFMSGRNDLALSDFNRTLSIKPDDARALYYRSLICRGMNTLSQASKDSCER
ncbi:MAG TPA: tetratricopeptide repeat protein [Thermodesulfovibrionales bacterium]|nr:tetratricopeptide repeat protein [Thermodesulfovibrionales bacterium]